MLRNLEEQVLYLTNKLEEIMQSLGNAIPDPIPGPQGEPGEPGEQGNPGPQGYSIVGFGTQVPASGRDGDWFLLKKSTMTGIDYVMCRCIMQHWVEQFSIRGPAGPIANATEVVANPNEPMSEELKKLKVDGVVYGTPTGNYVKYIAAPESTTLTDEQIADIIDGVFVEGTFLGYKNPVLFPAGDNGSSYKGIIISTYGDAGASSIQIYSINKGTKIISTTGDRMLTLGNIYSLNGQFIPDFPDNPANDKVLVFNTSNQLVWQNKPTAGMTIYRHIVNCTAVVGGYNLNLEFIFESSLDSAIADTSELWSYIYVYQLCNFIGAVSVINNKGSVSIEITDIKTSTTTTVNKADITVNSDTFSAI